MGWRSHGRVLLGVRYRPPEALETRRKCPTKHGTGVVAWGLKHHRSFWSGFLEKNKVRLKETTQVVKGVRTEGLLGPLEGKGGTG